MFDTTRYRYAVNDADSRGTAVASASNETPAVAGTLGTLPTVVKAGATIALLAALAAIALALIPVSATARGMDSYNPDGTEKVACGSVLMPSGDDALANNTSRTAAVVCSSARVQRAGWSGATLGGSIVVLVFSLLMGDGMAQVPDPRSPEARRSPDRDPAE
ncbi:hypothetical protein ACIQ9Q_25495 [Streptomyces sp. NPDC094438]|uniref:hypothetical protein n=1 Tax=Streptomyces sp. NPDC094438 TaxID=3366061 RepID=UPI0038291794